MAEVECGRCLQNLPAEEAYRCVCGNVFFCSQECFDKSSHAKIEDDEHELANSLTNANIGINLSRLRGKGKYQDLVTELAMLIIRKANGEAKEQLDSDLQFLITRFQMENKKVSANVMGCTIQSLAGPSNTLVGFWSSDAPLAKKNIQNQMTNFNLKVVNLFKNNTEDNQVSLTTQAVLLGSALNGKRK
jgi:hypothetical protein